MSIRITRISDAHETVLRIDGQLRSADVAELAKEYRSVDGTLVLELSNLQSADPAGVEVLLELVSMGVQMRGASPYIELLLKQRTDTFGE
jgi:ABC-type transporter Mla MlaB component